MFRKIQEARENEEGFTLIELLVVVIIIGILAAIAIPTFLSQRESAYSSAVQSDLRNAATAQESFLVDNPAYATTAANLEAAGSYNQSSEVVYDEFITDAANSYCMVAHHTADPDAFWKFDSASGEPVTSNATGCSIP